MVDPRPTIDATAGETAIGPPPAGAVARVASRVIHGIGSLKLTVALFAMAIFIVLAGTVAQIDRDIWVVVRDFFRTPIAWIEVGIFFPRDLEVPGRFPFPGGFLIGALLAVNLVAAHLVRFKIRVRGWRLAAGLALAAAGIGVTWWVVTSPGDGAGNTGSADRWRPLWIAIYIAVGLICVTACWRLVATSRENRGRRRVLAGIASAAGGLLAWLLLRGDTLPLGDSSMRILWQLIQGGVASLMLLAGCGLLFGKRAGIFLLHAGVTLLMVNELIVYRLHDEAQMSIREGQTVDFAQDIRQRELAIVNTSGDASQQQVVVIPESILRRDAQIENDRLPFHLHVVRYLQNTGPPRRLPPGETSLATVGTGSQWTVAKEQPGTGTDTDRGVDMAAVYVRLTEKQSGRDLGTYLLSMYFSGDQQGEAVTIDGATYAVSLRFRRIYKPYRVQLLDVRADTYVGTQIAKNYSSDVRLIDSANHVDRKVRIWMNNPLRYRGDTLYQSEYRVDPQTGREVTGLQVVANTGWMIPYVGCMIVATGMLAHFWLVLMRFVGRRDRAGVTGPARVLGDADGQSSADAGPAKSSVAKWFPWGVVAVAVLFLGVVARPRSQPPETMALAQFGALPVVYQGRVKPFDTLARNSLRILSGRQTLVDRQKKRQSATRWLLDVITDTAEPSRRRVFRIENLELLTTLGLRPRKGLRFAIDEFRDQFGEVDRQSRLAGEVASAARTAYQKKVIELERKLQLYLLLRESFQVPQLRDDHIKEDLERAARRRQQLAQLPMPRIIPPPADQPAAQWEPYTHAIVIAWAKSLSGTPTSRFTPALAAVLASYQQNDPEAFNQRVADYQALLLAQRPADFDPGKTQFETIFNRLQPFFWSALLYLVVFVLTACAWLGWSRPLNRAAFWLTLLTLLVHTAALVARVYISGRPPVTNLYSSAIFLGWGCVVFGLVLERLFPIGVGNIVAAVAGFASLLIAHLLAGDGDTFTVMQAVLDTQFWLATHVVCIVLGYSATFVAGLLGIVYIVRGVLTPSLTAGIRDQLTRMIYGTLCFAILFSFVGTVLGGLWADDSWGRFWGWDPKENGALIIVIWNALVLHARWGGMVRDRGLAVLAIGGNITTSWSWFGVNELGAGLHSYGFTEGVTLTLLLFAVSQLALIALGLIPTRYWWSSRSQAPAWERGS